MKTPAEIPVRPGAPAPRKRGPGRWYYFFLAALGVGTLGASMAVGMMTSYIDSLPPIERLENYDPAEGSVIYDRTGALRIGEFATEKRKVLSIDQIPDQLQHAFISIEDERFYKHYGVDLRGFARSVVTNVRRGRMAQGSSTITMQLPRNILPEQVGREKTPIRKIQEALLTFQIEQRYSKPQILEFYMNHIFLGYNSYGIHAAAETYFAKTPDRLSISECAILAGIPQRPSVFNPIADPERCKGRRDLVLLNMHRLGYINDEEYQTAIDTPIRAVTGRRQSTVASSEFPYFVDGLSRDLSANYEITRSELNQRGMTIRSTLNPEFQRIAQEELVKGLARVEKTWNLKKAERYWKEAEEMPGGPHEGQTRLVRIAAVNGRTLSLEFEGFKATLQTPEKLPYYHPDEILKSGNRLDVKITGVDEGRRTFTAEMADTGPLQGSVAILDTHGGEVLALVGGADFYDAAAGGQYNRAIQGGRPAGSTVKPFFYATAFERGMEPNDIVVDEPIIYPSRPPYKPQNFERRFFGATTLIEGLEHSRNVVTVRLFEAMGVSRALKKVIQFDSAPANAVWKRKFRPELPVCLGSIDMNTLELASAYLVFANQGVERKPQYFQKIDFEGGSPARTPDPQESVILDPVVAYQMLYLLRQAVVHGTAKTPIGDVFPAPAFPIIVGKTGTTDLSTEAWFAGMTPDLVMVVYVGFDTQRTIGPKMTGGKVAGPIWADIYKRLYATRTDWAMNFEVPPGVVSVDICAVTGKRASNVCSESSHKVYHDVPFKREKVPEESCDGVVRTPIIEPVTGEIFAHEEVEEADEMPEVKSPKPDPESEAAPTVEN